MDMKRTSRGFAYYDFRDGNGTECSVQKSSAAEADFIWLGANEIGLKRFTPGRSWEPVELQDDFPFGVTHSANNRMHLTRENVRALLPILQRFANTGQIDDPEADDDPAPDGLYKRTSDGKVFTLIGQGCVPDGELLVELVDADGRRSIISGKDFDCDFTEAETP